MEVWVLKIKLWGKLESICVVAHEENAQVNYREIKLPLDPKHYTQFWSDTFFKNLDLDPI
jgi:hypothetical protein